MIQQFDIKDFKGHENYNEFLLPGLTIVTGTNNSGKSSLLQSIFLLTQNKAGTSTTLDLNHDLRLGSFTDVLNKDTDREDTLEFIVYFDPNGFEQLRVQLIYRSQSVFHMKSAQLGSLDTPVLSGIEIRYKRIEEEIRYMSFKRVEHNDDVLYQVSGDTDQGYCKLQGLVPEPIIYCDLEKKERTLCSNDLDNIREHLMKLNKENIRYLKAFRLDEFKDAHESKSHDLGLSGEYTAELIHTRLNQEIDFLKADQTQYKFSELFDRWIHELLGPEYRVRAKLDNGQYRIEVDELERGFKFDLNQVGFGISQLLPLLTLFLTSKRGDVILIENPEVHLHPKLQALFTDICMFAMEHGRKIVVETHSEHIINRTRLKIKQTPEVLPLIKVYFFEKVKGYIQHTSIEITPEGKLQHWPANFFDQTYHDLLGLIE